MWMFKGAAARGDVQQDQFLTSLTTFIELYNCREDYFKMTADNLSAQAQKQSAESAELLTDNAARALFGGFCGASLGGAFGALGGCVAGGLGAVCAAALFSEDLNPLSATAGFFGGVIGGAAGATCAGVLGGGLGAAAESVEYSIDNDVYRVFWGLAGGVTGAGIGNIFGGEVGFVGGTFGGSLGGLLGVSATLGLIKVGLGPFKDVRQKPQKQKNKPLLWFIQKNSVIQTFKQKTSPLVAELSGIHTSSKMDRRSGARRVAAQSSKCLTAVSKAEKTLAHMEYTEETTSCLKQAAKQCKEVSEEFEKMKCEAEKLLATWS